MTNCQWVRDEEDLGMFGEMTRGNSWELKSTESQLQSPFTTDFVTGSASRSNWLMKSFIINKLTSVRGLKLSVFYLWCLLRIRMTVENEDCSSRPFTVHTRHFSQILELRTLSKSHATKMEIPTLSEGQMAKFKLLKHWTYGHQSLTLRVWTGLLKLFA